MPNQSHDVALEIQVSGGIQRMDPLTAVQVAVKNNVGVHYFQSIVPMNVLFVEDGTMGESCWRLLWLICYCFLCKSSNKQLKV